MLDSYTLPFPDLQIRAGVLVVDGWGITIRVLYGRLCIEDGIGPHRRSIVVDRTSGLERLVLLSKSGCLTLESLAWARSCGAAFVQITADGSLVTSSVPFAYEGHPIRRAQGLALVTGLDVKLARYVIAEKLDGERKNLVRLGVNDLSAFDALRESLDRAMSVDDVRLCEAQCASIYWRAWSRAAIRFRSRDLARIPAHWVRFDSRGFVTHWHTESCDESHKCFAQYAFFYCINRVSNRLIGRGGGPIVGVASLGFTQPRWRVFRLLRDYTAGDRRVRPRPARRAYLHRA